MSLLGTTARTAIGLAGLVAAIAACAGAQQSSAPVATATTTASEGGGSSATVAAAAWCDREAACTRMGAGRVYKSRDACIDDRRDRVAAHFAQYACPRGIDASKLDACGAAIRATPCGADVRLREVPECTKESLCPPNTRIDR